MNSLPRSSRTLHLRHRDLSSAGGSQSVTSVSVVRPMQRLAPRIERHVDRDEAQGDVALREAEGTQTARYPTRAPATSAVRGAHAARPRQSLQPLVIPLEAMQRTVPEAAPQSVASATLLQGCKTVQIMHNGEQYTLRATRHGKLILTK